MEDPGQRQGIFWKYCGEAVGIYVKTEWQHEKSVMEHYKKKFLSYCYRVQMERNRKSDISP